MKKTLGITPLLCSIFLTSSVAMGVDFETPAEPTREPIAASALRPNSFEAEKIAESAVDGEPGKWLSGSIVGSWADGYGAASNRGCLTKRG